MLENDFGPYLVQARHVDDRTEEIRHCREDLRTALHKLEGAVVPEDVTSISDAIDEFDSYSAQVSLIGQVKAGKTALANALIGESNLLPSDVNPWTSVVTSMHINCIPPKGKRAIFRFFDNDDWDDLVSDSGRIVQIAKKAKLDSRLDELVKQVQELRTRTQTRLGKNFELLLGNNHSFSSFNGDLVKRYVCLGEDDALQDREGRFADLTKSADLYLESDYFEYPITLADTPGVNDPFLIREAATLQNLGTSDVCVIVLNAHQALSSVDLGLMRLLKSLKSKRLIAFVNRIDELPDPENQIHEIRDFITGILKKQKLDTDIPIIFGSAAWADAAINNNLDDLTDDSIESLAALIAARKAKLAPDSCDAFNIENLSDVSGISALRAAIGQKVWNEVYRPKIATEANRTRRMAERSLLYLAESDKSGELKVDATKIGDAVSDLTISRRMVRKSLQDYKTKAIEKIKMDFVSSYMRFNKSEKVRLLSCLSSSGKVKDWSPETEDLRNELNAAYDTYSNDAVEFFRGLNSRLIKSVMQAYQKVLSSTDVVRITPHPIPAPPIPLSLMRTMSIDLRANSSLEWLRQKLDKSVYVEQFEAISSADLVQTVEETCNEIIETYLSDIGADLMNFLQEHSDTIEAFLKPNAGLPEDVLKGAGSDQTPLATRINTLRDAADILHALEGADTDDILGEATALEA